MRETNACQRHRAPRYHSGTSEAAAHSPYHSAAVTDGYGRPLRRAGEAGRCGSRRPLVAACSRTLPAPAAHRHARTHAADRASECASHTKRGDADDHKAAAARGLAEHPQRHPGVAPVARRVARVVRCYRQAAPDLVVPSHGLQPWRNGATRCNAVAHRVGPPQPHDVRQIRQHLPF